MDIVITFFTSYETVQQREETELKKIAYNYLTGWFTVDFIATFPY